MIIERTCYLPKPGRFDEVLATRRQASRVRIAIGLRAGTITVGKTERGRMVFWEARFATVDEQEADLAARAASADFEACRARMSDLNQDFDRQIVREDRGAEVCMLRDVALDDVPIAPQELTFESDGRSLKGYFYRPPGEGPFPCMITNHGSTIEQGTTDVCRPGVAAVLMAWGVASFLPHRRGYGNSPGIPWREQVAAEYGTRAYDERLAGRLDDESDDVVAALDAMTRRPEVDPAHIGVMGSSFGGTVTLLAAAKSARLRCAVEFAGAAMNWERASRLRALMLDAASRLTQPIFFIQAANDYSIRPTIELAASLEGTGKVVQSRIYPDFGLTRDEGHLLYIQGPAYWGDDVRRFLERWL
jgi:carboxymethylenebutenolidase